MNAKIDPGPGDRHGSRQQRDPGPQAMPEQEGQRKGKADGAVIAGEGVIRRVMQELIADACGKRTLMREEQAKNP